MGLMSECPTTFLLAPFSIGLFISAYLPSLLLRCSHVSANIFNVWKMFGMSSSDVYSAGFLNHDWKNLIHSTVQGRLTTRTRCNECTAWTIVPSYQHRYHRNLWPLVGSQNRNNLKCAGAGWILFGETKAKQKSSIKLDRRGYRAWRWSIASGIPIALGT